MNPRTAPPTDRVIETPAVRPGRAFPLVARLLLSAFLMIAGTGCGRTTVIVQQPAMPPPPPTSPVTPVDPTLARTTGGADATTGIVPLTLPNGTSAQVALKEITVTAGTPPTVTATVNGASTRIDASVLAADVKANPQKYKDLVAKGLATQAQVDALAALAGTTTPMARTVGGADASTAMVTVQPAAAAATGTTSAAAPATVQVALKDFTFPPPPSTTTGALQPPVPVANVTLNGVPTQVDVTTLKADATANLPKYQTLVTKGLITQAQLDALTGGTKATALGGAQAPNGEVQVKKPDGTQVVALLRDFSVAGTTVQVVIGGQQFPCNVSALQADVRANLPKYQDFVTRGLMTQTLLTALGGNTTFAFGTATVKDYTLPGGV